jgi:Tfp pilus assembly protein PilO
VNVKPSDIYRLTKALPNATDMAGVLLDVNRLAGRNGLEFRSITPSAATPGSGYVMTPVEVVVQGRFGAVSNFLGDLRTLVTVKKHRLDSRGRLYSVGGISLGQPDAGKKFPIVKASVTVRAYTFSAPAPTTPSDQSPSATPSSSGTVAAGATP